jgi:hypothetical protein
MCRKLAVGLLSRRARVDGRTLWIEEVGGEFILVAGSTVAGTTSSNRATQIYAPAVP